MSSSSSTARPATPAGVDEPVRSHREVLLPMSGLLMAMFVAILAGTVVSTSLPVIIAELGGGQGAYTWVVTATLLTTTITTPIWGKLADLLNRKLLVQIAISIFVIGTVAAGFSQDTGTMIAMRAVQGIGAGGLTALVQIVLADIVSPRERGKYMGLFGAVMAVGTVGGPLLGGFITDAIHWRGNFFVSVPFAVVALIVLQKTLHLPARPAKKLTIDYLGAGLLSGAVSLLLIWVTLAGTNFDWLSGPTYLMVGGAILLAIAFVVVELRTSEPLIPLSLFRRRTFTLAVLSSIAVGVAMFGTSVFLSQYMQLARGATPTQSGLMTLPMVLALMISSTVVGQLITRSGKWKRFMVTGSVMLTVGLALMGTIEFDTPFVLVSIYMAILGAGVGMVMQNLVLIVQNDVRPQEIGVASSGVAFFRSMGGTIGVSVLGAVLGSRVVSGMTENSGALQAAIAASGAEGKAAAAELASGTLPEVRNLPGPIAAVVESVYGSAVADLFLVAAPLALLTIVAIAFLPNAELGNQTTTERMKPRATDSADDTGSAAVGLQKVVLPATGQGAAGQADLPAPETLVEVSEAMVGAIPDLDGQSGGHGDAGRDGR